MNYARQGHYTYHWALAIEVIIAIRQRATIAVILTHAVAACRAITVPNVSTIQRTWFEKYQIQINKI